LGESIAKPTLVVQTLLKLVVARPTPVDVLTDLAPVVAMLELACAVLRKFTRVQVAIQGPR
jgi:hypothetical protein